MSFEKNELGYGQSMLLHFMPMLTVMGGVLREHGHKTWIAWAIVGVAVVIGMLGRFYRRRR